MFCAYSGLSRFDQDIVEIFFHAAVAREIGVDELCGFFLFDAELLGEAERGKTVNDAEVDGFGGAAMLGGLRQGADAENFLSGARVNVLAGSEGLDQHGSLEKCARMRNSICE